MNTIGKRLAYARKFRGYTQDDLARASSVSRGVIGNIETNRAKTQTVYLLAFCQALDINSEWLIHGTGPMEPDNERSKILNELYKVCATLTEPQQKYLLETIRLMREHLIEE